MKNAKKILILTMMVVLIIGIIYGLIHNKVEAGYAIGGEGKLEIYNTTANWFDGWSDMTENGDGWGPYWTGAKKGTYFWRGTMDDVSYWGFNLDTMKSFTNVYCAQKNNLLACPVMWCTISWSVDIVR